MKRIIYFLLLVFISFGYAQDSKHKFGEITKEEIQLKVCSFDSTATALVLFDIGESKFERDDNSFEIRFKKHKRIKILKNSSEDYSEVRIPLYDNQKGTKEKVRRIKAVTYNFENGELIQQELDKKGIYEEVINDNWFQKKFVFPNVKAGSIIEFEYEVVSPYKFNLVDWEFQSELPTLYSEYKVHMVPFYEYMSSAQGIKSFDIQSSIKSKKGYNNFGVGYKNYIHTYGLKNIEAFKDENYITSKNDYIKKIDFQLSKVIQPDGKEEKIITTWDALREDLLKKENFGIYLKNAKKIATKILNEKIDLAGLNENEKIIKLIDFTKSSFHLDDSYYSKYSNKSAKEFYKTKRGNVGCINLFLVALLNAADVKAEPVIISTRSHGKLNVSYPFASASNYVLVYIKNSNSFLTDGTSSHLKYNMIPTNCVNDYGLLVDKSNESKWIQVKYSKPSIDQINFSIKVDEESMLTNFSIKMRHSQFRAQRFRERFLNDTLEIKKYYSGDFDIINNIETKEYENTINPYEISFEASKEVEQLGEFIIIKPYNAFSLNENRLTEKKRNYPVDFIYPIQKRFLITLEVPNGYELDKLPENIQFVNELISLWANYKLVENKLQIMSSYEFKKAVYSPEEYTELVGNIDKIVEEFNKEIYLKKAKK